MLGYKSYLTPCDRIARLPYVLIGATLLLVKIALDQIIASFVFERSWSVWNYISPGSPLVEILKRPEDRAFFLTMLAISIPFIAIGVMTTINRLRDAEMPLGLSLLFFAPIVNFILFLQLSIVSSRQSTPADLETVAEPAEDFGPVVDGLILNYGTDAPTPVHSAISRFVPASPGGAFAVAILVSVGTTLLATILSVNLFRDYGLGIFVAMPFTQGMIASLIFGMRERRTWGQSVGVACASIVAGFSCLVFFGMEGVGCLIMALPLILPLAILGAVAGHAIQKSTVRPRTFGGNLISLMLLLPFILGAEWITHPKPTVFCVTSSVEVNAPPEIVWQSVIKFPPIPPPKDMIFRLGVAYPMRAEIDGSGPGSIRRCVFSTGAFIEPIEIWDAPRLLKFAVTSNPPAMKEWSPYSDIEPPHIKDFLQSHGGQFELVALPGGCTLLKGTTWYEHNLWPESYWTLWSDYLIHHIHLRVLNHVKELSEANKS